MRLQVTNRVVRGGRSDQFLLPSLLPKQFVSAWQAAVLVYVLMVPSWRLAGGSGA